MRIVAVTEVGFVSQDFVANLNQNSKHIGFDCGLMWQSLFHDSLLCRPLAEEKTDLKKQYLNSTKCNKVYYKGLFATSVSFGAYKQYMLLLRQQLPDDR